MLKHCTIGYTFYETDYRVRRYAELYSNNDNNMVHVISLRSNNNKICHLNGAKIYRVQKREYNEKGPLSYFIKIMVFFFLAMFRVTVNHIKYRYDVIHIHNVPDFLVFTAIIPKLLGAKVILDIHDILPELYCEKFHVSGTSMLAKMLKFVEFLSVKFANYVIVANDIWAKKIKQRNKLSDKKCITILNYPNTSFFTGKMKTDRNDGTLRLIYPGHLSHHHGIDIAVDALAILKSEGLKFHFDIYARTFVATYFDKLKARIAELNLDDNITFNEPITPEQIPGILYNADMGIIPKRGGGFAGEAFSTKLLEYLAAGLPTVASSTTIDRYYFVDDTIITFFDDGDHVDCAKKIRELYNDKILRDTNVKNGLAYIQHNNWPKKSELYKNIINAIKD